MSSPFKRASMTPELRKQANEAKVVKLTQEIEELEILLNGKDAEAIVQRHIKLLHTYNERKDATLIMLAKIANIESCTVQEIQTRLGIESDLVN